MNKLTENQINFLLEYFFENEKYAGWKGIATTLLTEGTCIVAGTKCIWNGGIGNFIKTTSAENFIGFSLYEFDLDNFLKSLWYKEISNLYIAELATKKRDIEEEYNDICNL